MNKRFPMIFTAVMCAMAISSSNVFAGDLTIDLQGVQAGKGKIMIAIFDSAETYLKKPIRTMKTAATDAIMHVKIEGVEAGKYAVTLYQDLNENGKLDSNFLRIPNEPYGFSNNAKGSFGPPKFSAAQFDLPSDGKAISITLVD